jgi:hypothetical protein
MLNEQAWMGSNGFNSLRVGPVAGSSKLVNDILFSVKLRNYWISRSTISVCRGSLFHGIVQLFVDLSYLPAVLLCWVLKYELIAGGSEGKICNSRRTSNWRAWLIKIQLTWFAQEWGKVWTKTHGGDAPTVVGNMHNGGSPVCSE